MDDTIYHYVKNLQGDVVRVLDENGNTVVEYSYDPWGVPTVTGDTELAEINPCSYRGYDYDEETGYYYLQSRYYDPEIGRFINGDEPLILGADETLLGYNLFVYCGNNPVVMADYDGHAMINVIFAAIGCIVGWELGDYIAKSLGYFSGQMYWLIRLGVVAGGGVIGWFSASIMTKMLANYLGKRIELVFKIIGKYGLPKAHSFLNFMGVNPFSLTNNTEKFIGLAKFYNSKIVTLGYSWAIQLYNKATLLGIKVMLDVPHGGYGWHIHLNGANGKLKGLYIQITKAAWDYLSKIIK